MTKLNLGCGSRRLKGFINVDLENWSRRCDLVADARDLSTFEDNSVDHIFNHALLEHIPPWDTLRALKTWFRVLKPGGTIQVEVPGLERIFRGWLIEGTITEQRAIDLIFGGNKNPVNGYQFHDHLTGFNFTRLERFLSQVGFVDIVEGKSTAGKPHEILVVKARKP